MRQKLIGLRIKPLTEKASVNLSVVENNNRFCLVSSSSAPGNDKKT